VAQRQRQGSAAHCSNRLRFLAQAVEPFLGFFPKQERARRRERTFQELLHVIQAAALRQHMRQIIRRLGRVGAVGEGGLQGTFSLIRTPDPIVHSTEGGEHFRDIGIGPRVHFGQLHRTALFQLICLFHQRQRQLIGDLHVPRRLLV